MNTKRILIIEDNLSYALDLEMFLHQEGHEVVGVIDNADEAIVAAYEHEPDLAIVDINLARGNGLQVAYHIRELLIPIIYITIRKDKKSFELAKSTNVIQYLVKPVDMLTLKATIDLMPKPGFQEDNGKRNGNHPGFLFVKNGKKLEKIDVAQLMWLSSDGNYCSLHTHDKRFLIKKSMRSILTALPEEEFIKIHKSHIVRLECIEEFYPSESKVKVNGKFFPVGRTAKSELIKRLKRLK